MEIIIHIEYMYVHMNADMCSFLFSVYIMDMGE